MRGIVVAGHHMIGLVGIFAGDMAQRDARETGGVVGGEIVGHRGLPGRTKIAMIAIFTASRINAVGICARITA